MTGNKTVRTGEIDSHIQENFIARFKQVILPGMGLAEEMADVPDLDEYIEKVSKA